MGTETTSTDLAMSSKQCKSEAKFVKAYVGWENVDDN